MSRRSGTIPRETKAPGAPRPIARPELYSEWARNAGYSHGPPPATDAPGPAGLSRCLRGRHGGAPADLECSHPQAGRGCAPGPQMMPGRRGAAPVRPQGGQPLGAVPRGLPGNRVEGHTGAISGDARQCPTSAARSLDSTNVTPDTSSATLVTDANRTKRAVIVSYRSFPCFFCVFPLYREKDLRGGPSTRRTTPRILSQAGGWASMVHVLFRST